MVTEVLFVSVQATCGQQMGLATLWNLTEEGLDLEPTV